MTALVKKTKTGKSAPESGFTFNLPGYPALMNEEELKSVRSLVAYVAYDKQLPADEVENQVATRFRAMSISTLPSKSYDEVVRFLVDLLDNLSVQ